MQLCIYTYKGFRIWEGKKKQWAMQNTGEKSEVGGNGSQSLKHENVLPFKVQNYNIMGRGRRPFWSPSKCEISSC